MVLGLSSLLHNLGVMPAYREGETQVWDFQLRYMMVPVRPWRLFTIQWLFPLLSPAPLWPHSEAEPATRSRDPEVASPDTVSDGDQIRLDPFATWWGATDVMGLSLTWTGGHSRVETGLSGTRTSDVTLSNQVSEALLEDIWGPERSGNKSTDQMTD